MSVNDEGRDMWKVYLDLKEYAAALANCRDPFQRDQVYLAQVMDYWLRYLDLRSPLLLQFEFICVVHNTVIWDAG